MLHKTLKIAGLFILMTVYMASNAYANEITAINFNGDIIGTVIPDGSVIGKQNDIIGKVTADSFIVNNNNEIIGGVVPQGIAIGNDNKFLGKVNNDGTVRLPTGKIIGKTLPNALVVDDSYNIIGAVLYPGLIYNNEGDTIGRLTGDGLYVSIEGQNIGFVSAMGYAYKNTGTDYVLDGKLVSSKMVVSLTGEFIGSVAPGGKVTDFDAKVIGSVHANGYVYNKDNQIVGKVITGGYTIDTYGKYLGFISYNGEVINKGETVGRLRADNKIIDTKGKVIGYFIEISATATDFNGKYLGRVIPDGKIVKTTDVIGSVGARGIVYNIDGAPIGEVTYAGPVFDYLGNLSAIALRSGSAVSTKGTLVGYVKGQYVFDNIGRMLGAGMEPMQIINLSDTILGMNFIGADFNKENIKYKVSPFGYVYSSDNILTGNAIGLTTVYDQAGLAKGYVDVDGKISGMPTERQVKLTQFGQLIDEQNLLIGYNIDPYYVMSLQMESLGHLGQNNLVINNSGTVIAKIIPEYQAVESTNDVKDNLMPIIGYAGNNQIAVGINGNMLGYVRRDGIVYDFQLNKIGSVVENETVIGNDNSIIGKLVGFRGVVNDSCEFSGVVSPRGDVRNSRDIVIGRVLTNGQVVSDTQIVNSFIPLKGLVTDFGGNNLGTVTALGRVLNYEQADLGCIRSDGRLYDSNNTFKGAVVTSDPVINYDDVMIGRVLLSGKVVNIDNEIVGYVLPNLNIVAQNKKKIIGMAFKYKFAFDKENNFIGRVNRLGEVISNENKVLAKVTHNGEVVSEGKEIGYALYDVYIYDENNKAIGYLTQGGSVVGFSGNRLGKADRGFLIDKEYNIIGRGARDYFIRNRSNEIIGELQINGDIVDNTNSVIGKIDSNGDIRNEKGKMFAKAFYLQYYNIQKPVIKTQTQEEDTKIKMGELSAPEPAEKISQQIETEKATGKYGLKAIGIALTPDGNYLGEILQNNDVIDKLGNMIGKKMPDGLIIDNDGALVGIEEVKNTSADKMFIPSGSFGDGAAYGTGNQPNNLGPGGGFGAGERYDPMRAQILDANQNLRRSELAIGKISTQFSKEAFDGMQTHWDGVPRKISTWRVDMSEMILADKPIPAVLARTLMSGAENVPVTAIVERNIYAEVGRNIVIPAGSRVMGTMGGFNGGGGTGSAVRVNITWERLIRPDGSAFEFASAQTGDAQGRAGALGYIDEQLLKKYTLPIVTSTLTSALAFVTAAGENKSDGNGGSTEDARADAASDARQNFITGMNEIFNQILESKTNIAAVSYVPAGTRLIIYPKVDLWIRTAAREREEAAEESVAPGPLIDGNEGKKEDKKDLPKAGGGSSGSKIEVYGGESSNAEPEGVALIDDEPQKKSTPKQMPSYATTPPPSTGDVVAPPSSNSTAGSGATLF
ncbi:MAG: TrbI/VirB10 family protein [Alphaproteobacteria bacterium]|nr:TrbI/VirB10 family protein [Alphaproteobacteria bacterium]